MLYTVYFAKFIKFFCKNTLTKEVLFSIIMDVRRGLVQSVEHRSPKPSVVGSSPPAPAKNESQGFKSWLLFFCDMGELK